MAVRASQAAKKSERYATEVRDLGERIRALRKARRWTLEQAAEAMNLDLKHLQKIESGTLNITMVTLVRIADGLGEPMAALFKPLGRSSKGK